MQVNMKFLRSHCDFFFLDNPSIERRRDIVVKTDVDDVYCLFSIEHQSTIDKNMVIRYGNYEMTEYLK